MSNFKKAIKEAFATASFYGGQFGGNVVPGMFFKTLYENMKNNNGQPAPKDNTPPNAGSTLKP